MPKASRFRSLFACGRRNMKGRSAGVAALLVATMVLAGCNSGSDAGSDDFQGIPSEIPTDPVTLKVARSKDFVMPPATADAYWSAAVAEFTKRHPNVTIEQVVIPGAYTDLVTKLSLLYNSPETAPSVAQLPEARYRIVGRLRLSCAARRRARED